MSWHSHLQQLGASTAIHFAPSSCMVTKQGSCRSSFPPCLPDNDTQAQTGSSTCLEHAADQKGCNQHCRLSSTTQQWWPDVAAAQSLPCAVKHSPGTADEGTDLTAVQMRHTGVPASRLRRQASGAPCSSARHPGAAPGWHASWP